MEIIALTLSALALALSGLTAWLALGRKGQLKMTRPAVFFLGFDSTPDRPDPKVFFRALLFSTAQKGQLVESMFVRLSRGESSQNFTIWVYGDRSKLERGSGLYVGKEGVAKNHHFLLAPDQSAFAFQAGKHQLKVYASMVGRTQPFLLHEARLQLTAEHAKALEDRRHGVYFDWGPDARTYHSVLDARPDKFDWEPVVKAMLQP